MSLELDVNSPTNTRKKPRKSRAKNNIRRELLGLYNAGKYPYLFTLKKWIDNFLTMCEYSLAVPSRKPRCPMDVDKMLADWKEAVVKITLAPDKKTVDEWEAKLNDLLEPFLKAPIKQIREFSSRLVAEVESDPNIPFFIKRGIEAYIKIFVEGAKDETVLTLKTDVARRIALAVEGDVQPQLCDAITNALMWRDPATLKKIEKATKKEGRPPAKLVGRESCLFLEVDGETVML